MTARFEALRAYWSAHGLTPGPGVTADALTALEELHGLHLPHEVRAYFTCVNGVVGGRDGAWDADLIAFWPLREVQPLSTLTPGTMVPHAERMLVFADWSIDAWFYAALLPEDAAGPAPVFIVGDDHALPVARSLSEFFTRYMDGDPIVRYGSPRAPTAR